MIFKHPLIEAISQGESKILEFKRVLPKGEQLAKTIIAFANTSGGKLVIGVNDDRALVGLNNKDIFTLQDTIASITHSCCTPNILPAMYIENINGIELLIIDVNRGPLLPYYLNTKGKERGTYIRLGATNRQASQEYIQELERQRLNLCFDEQINHSVEFESLDLSPLEQRFILLGKPLNTDKMLNLKLIKQEGGKAYPTHGLLILLGYYEHVETKCSRFKGTTMSVFLDKKEYTGDLFTQLEQTLGFIQNHLHLKAEILGLQRTETYELPMPAIREALVNALIHRDYTNYGRDIKVGIYDDILNIVSPGGLPNGLTTTDLKQGRSEIRNRTLARVFKTLGYIEQWGSGIQRIKDQCLEAKVNEPRLTEGGDFVDWVFPRPSPAKNDEKPQNLGKTSGKPSGKTSGKILSMIGNNPNITIPELATAIGVSERSIERNLKKLQEARRLTRIGAAKGGHWEVLE